MKSISIIPVTFNTHLFKRIAICISLMVLLAVTGQARDPWLEPFHENSIWNHPIGSWASLVDAKLQWEPNIQRDEEYLVKTYSADPVKDIYIPTSWTDRWPGSFAWWQGKMHVPSWFQLQEVTPPVTPNNGAAFLMPDKTTLVQLNPATRVGSWAHISGYRSKNVYLYGMGVPGGHGGSGMSTIGGAIRQHEWGSNKNINHALKVNLQASQYLYYDNYTKGFRWPALTADDYAASVYGGSVYALRMGALLTFQPGTNHSSIGGLSTWQAKKIFDAMYKYGAYVVDDTAWDAHAICTESTVSLPVWDSNFRSDMNKIFQNLWVVNNNSEWNVGGGGSLRTSQKSSLGAPTGGFITLQAIVNNRYVVAENGGNSPLIANRTGAGGWETFEVVNGGGGYIGLKAQANGKYVSVGSGNVLTANANWLGDWEKFIWEYHDNGKRIALKSKKTNKYVAAENNGNSSLAANRSSVGNWEKFVPGGGTGAWTQYGSNDYLNKPGQ